MADDPNSTFTNNSAIVIALLSAVALAFGHSAPLQDARPSSKEPQIHETVNVQSVEARLWQDPFTAVAKARERQPVGSTESDLAAHRNPISEQIGLLGENEFPEIIIATVSAAPYPEAEEDRRRMRYAIVSGLDVMNFVPSDWEHIGYVETCPQGITARVNARRACGSFPSERLPAVIPFELFREKHNPYKKILVLWLDEDVLREHPLKKFKNLAEFIYLQSRIGPQSGPSMHVIGPSTSDTLRALLIESCDAQPPLVSGEKAFCNKANNALTADVLKKISFYAYGATVDDASLFSEVRGQDGEIVADFSQFSALPTLHEFLASRGVNLLRTIATDDILARTLMRELHLRGVDPGIQTRKTLKKDPEASRKDEQHIALISEWDTYYGRTFPSLIRNCAAEGKYDSETFISAVFTWAKSAVAGNSDNPGDQGFSPCPRLSDDDKPSWLHVRTYLRGLDGALPQANKADAKVDSHGDTSGKNDNLSVEESAHDQAPGQPHSMAAERAFGQGQYDYLRRLSSDLKEEEDALKRNEEGSIKAIGVVGGDVFDKLLVLRALKPEFPEAIFFTDDYDALLGLQSEVRWTRNLLIASSFGSKLRRERQRDLPPFRSYLETSAFLATQLAVADIEKRPEPASLQAQYSGPSADGQERGEAGFQPIDIVDVQGLATPTKKKRESGKSAKRRAGQHSTAKFSEDLGHWGMAPAVAGPGILQHKIKDWLEKPQIFEVERTGGMLALSQYNDCSKDTNICKDNCEHNFGAVT
jgi:hypothetical protein